MTTIPPNTRSTTNDDRLAALEISTHSLKQQTDSHREEFASMKGAMEALTDAVAKMSRAMESRGIRVDENHSEDNRDHGSINRNRETREGSRGIHQGGLQTRFARLDFPRFNGDNPTGWIYKAEQFFQLHEIPVQDRVALASFHLGGDTHLWYQLLKQELGTVLWEEFKEGLNSRYGPNQYMDFFAELTRLQQSSSV